MNYCYSNFEYNSTYRLIESEEIKRSETVYELCRNISGCVERSVRSECLPLPESHPQILHVSVHQVYLNFQLSFLLELLPGARLGADLPHVVLKLFFVNHQGR